MLRDEFLGRRRGPIIPILVGTTRTAPTPGVNVQLTKWDQDLKDGVTVWRAGGTGRLVVGYMGGDYTMIDEHGEIVSGGVVESGPVFFSVDSPAKLWVTSEEPEVAVGWIEGKYLSMEHICRVIKGRVTLRPIEKEGV